MGRLEDTELKAYVDHLTLKWATKKDDKNRLKYRRLYDFLEERKLSIPADHLDGSSDTKDGTSIVAEREKRLQTVENSHTKRGKKEYQVKQILECKYNKYREKMYLVWWEGYTKPDPASKTYWEPAGSFREEDLESLIKSPGYKEPRKWWEEGPSW